VNASPVRRGPALVIVGCSRRKRSALTPIPALELYEGGCVPQLRRRLGDRSALRDRVRILSAEHGLIEADRLLLPYDRVLTDQRAVELRPQVTQALHRDIETAGLPEAVLVAAEPCYQVLVTGVLTERFACPDLRTVSDVRDWGAVSAILDSWGWP
jgi:hypothetical protein